MKHKYPFVGVGTVFNSVAAVVGYLKTVFILLFVSFFLLLLVFSLKHVWSMKRKWNDCCRTPIKMKTLCSNGLIVYLKYTHTLRTKHTSTLASMRSTLNELPADSQICTQKINRISFEWTWICVYFLYSFIFGWFFFSSVIWISVSAKRHCILYIIRTRAHTHTYASVYICMYHEATQSHTSTHWRIRREVKKKRARHKHTSLAHIYAHNVG